MFDDKGSPTRSADRLEATADHLRPAVLPGSASIDRVSPALRPRGRSLPRRLKVLAGSEICLSRATPIGQ